MGSSNSEFEQCYCPKCGEQVLEVVDGKGDYWCEHCEVYLMKWDVV